MSLLGKVFYANILITFYRKVSPPPPPTQVWLFLHIIALPIPHSSPRAVCMSMHMGIGMYVHVCTHFVICEREAFGQIVSNPFIQS